MIDQIFDCYVKEYEIRYLFFKEVCEKFYVSEDFKDYEFYLREGNEKSLDQMGEY